jgi:membrane protease YdiL (CAAX protease family)
MASAATGNPDDSASYWNRTRRPLTSLVFLTPLLVSYEAGVLWLGGRDPDGLRSGADYWMRGGLEYLGLNQPWLLPVGILAGLMVWHLASGNPWRVGWQTLLGMLAESLLFAFLLVVFGQLQDYGFRHLPQVVFASISPQRTAALAVLFVGAGIYEETLFRLCLLPTCRAFFRWGRLSAGWSTTLAVLATSLAFSLAHYVGPAGEPFRLFTFAFRAVAGLYFAILFVLRGFGVTVGAHAGYDLIVGLVLSKDVFN